MISNTLFNLPPRRLYRWKSPSGATDNTIRNQIDYILINIRFYSSVKKVATYPGADIPSDHNLLAKLRTRPAAFKKSKPKTKQNLEKFKDENVKYPFESKIKQGINNIPKNAGSI